MINGVINIYKEKDYTSFDVVAKLRGILKQKKIGHTGTLDPNAEGVLLVCLGKATKLCDLLPDRDKTYRATLLLGVETDTEDTTGQVLKESPVEVDEEQVIQVINSFVGNYMQTPPMYSAIKKDGVKLYELARQGIVIEREKRPVTIYNIKILSMDLPRVTMEISCGKGTYIRSLCRDIGDKLGTGGCMDKLVRIRACGFDVKDSLTLDKIDELNKKGEIGNYIISIDTLYPEYTRIYVKPECDRFLNNGNRLDMEDFSHIEENKEKEYCLVYNSKREFCSIYRYLEDEGYYKTYKMFI